MPDIDLSQLSQNIEDAISSGFDRVMSAMSESGLFRQDINQDTGGSGRQENIRQTTSPAAPQIDTASALIDIEESLTAQAGIGVKKTKEVLNTTFEEMSERQRSFSVTLLQDITRNFGAELQQLAVGELQEEFFNGFKGIENEGMRVVANTAAVIRDTSSEMQQYMDLDDYQIYTSDLVKSMGDTSINLLKQLDKDTQVASAKFAKAMGLSMEEVGDLIAVNFAETGKSSDKILTDVLAMAEGVGKAVGIPTKQMVEGITEVKSDMETFTDITVEGAAKMVASLSQVGLSLSSFKGMLSGYRDFDAAADKIGDLSAMFGVQMDAMEMMYLANEDEGEFLHRMREQLLDQGMDVESMSKTRQRALASTLGMEVQEMKYFMSTGMEMASQEELAASAQEASTKTRIESLELLDDSMVKIVRSSENLSAIFQNIQAMFSAGDLTDTVEAFAGTQARLTEAFTREIGVSGLAIDLQQELASAEAVSLDYIERFIGASIPLVEGTAENLIQNTKTAFKSMSSSAAAAAADIANIVGGAFGLNNLSSDIENYINSAVSQVQALPDQILKTMETLNNRNYSVQVNANVSSSAVSEEVTNSVAEYIEKILKEFEKQSNKVDVNVDIESIKQDIVNALSDGINGGFSNSNHNIVVKISEQTLMDIIAKSSTTNGRTVVLQGGSD